MQEAFRIGTATLCEVYRAHENETCKKKLLAFLTSYGDRKELRQLYSEFLERQHSTEWLIEKLPDRKEWDACVNTLNSPIEKWSLLRAPNQKEMVDQLISNNDITADGTLIIYNFEKSSIKPEEYDLRSGVILNQEVEVEYANPYHKPYFQHFFSFMYSRTVRTEEFLEFHLKSTFQDGVGFSDFTMIINYGADYANQGQQDFLKTWIYRKLIQTRTIVNDFIIEKIISRSAYDYLINELSKLGYFSPNGEYIYSKKDKGVVSIALLQLLIDRGYFKQEIIWSNKLKAQFLKDAFCIKVSPKTSQFQENLFGHRKKFEFLPRANQLPK